LSSQKRFLAIIPARGGSKRLPGKNTIDLAGKPLIAWTIEAAKNCRYIDKTVISTDDDLIVATAQQYGAEVPFKRDPDLATDKASTVDVIFDVIQRIKGYEYIVLLQPTSPLRNSLHIGGAISELFKKNADAIISVTELDHPIEWTNHLAEDLSMKDFLAPSIQKKRSQDFLPRFRINGAIYIVKTEKFLEEKCLFLKDNIFAYKMNRSDSFDIDTKEDLLAAWLQLIDTDKAIQYLQKQTVKH